VTEEKLDKNADPPPNAHPARLGDDRNRGAGRPYGMSGQACSTPVTSGNERGLAWPQDRSYRLLNCSRRWPRRRAPASAAVRRLARSTIYASRVSAFRSIPGQCDSTVWRMSALDDAGSSETPASI